MSTRVTKQERIVLLAANRSQGCVCAPELTKRADGSVQTAHDDWCPLLRVMEERGPNRSPQVVLYNPAKFGGRS